MILDAHNVKQYKLLDAKGRQVNTVVLADDSDWVIPENHTLELIEISESLPNLVAVLTKLAFLRRFTSDERIAIRVSTDPVIVDFLHLLDLAQEVQLDDADTQAGVRYLESAGLLAAGRAEVILAPEQV